MITFENKSLILAELWLEFRTDEQFLDFFDYNDIGLPLAYAVANKIVEPLPIANKMIEETWLLFLEVLGLDSEDEELYNWTTLYDVFETAQDFGWEKE